MSTDAPAGTLGARLDRAVEAEARAVRQVLVAAAGLSAAAAERACLHLRREAWSALVTEVDLAHAGSILRLAGLRVAARALREEGIPRPGEGEPTPMPEGLSREALRDAYKEVIPGRRSVAGLHLRGYGIEELAALYGLDVEEMDSRRGQALESLRSAVHRRAQRMNRESWSRALESRPIPATWGMLRERPPSTAPGEGRLECTRPDDLARAVHGSHFRGGREAALDHAALCDACGAELRALLPLLRMPAACEGIVLDAGTRAKLRSRARARGVLPGAGPAFRPARRAIWPWAVAAILLAVALFLLL